MFFSFVLFWPGTIREPKIASFVLVASNEPAICVGRLFTEDLLQKHTHTLWIPMDCIPHLFVCHLRNLFRLFSFNVELVLCHCWVWPPEFSSHCSWLVVWNIVYSSIQLGMSSSQLTFIFFRRVGQPPTRYRHSFFQCTVDGRNRTYCG